MNIRLFLLPLIILSFQQALAQVPALDRIIPALEQHTALWPTEAVHVHMDKPYYLAGDTIWFKAYTVTGARHQLSMISEAIYVDLISETDSMVSSLKLPMTAGMAQGNIDLPNDLTPGNYRLRAYTQWMRNDDSRYFFDHLLLIGNIALNKTTASADFTYEATDGTPSIIATLHYADSAGSPLVGKRVSYSLHDMTEYLQSGKEVTDEQGNISFKLRRNADSDSSNMHIKSQIDIEKKYSETHAFPVKATYAAADVQFFPEGGDLITGLPSRVGFKAIGPDGNSLPISGVIKDSDQQEITAFETLHAGMGVFTLQPEAGKSYHAEITFPDQTRQNVPLAAAKPDGHVLSCYPYGKRDTMLLRIMTTDGAVKDGSLLVQAGGEIYFAADVPLHRSLVVVPVPLDNAPTGVAQVTLFDAEGRPLHERLVFLHGPDDLLELEVSTAKEQYTPRSTAELALRATTAAGAPTVANFSISVTDETQVPLDEETENHILAQLLLKSALTGHIEHPAYYFTDTAANSNEKLDVLMMTQGHRRITWEALLQDTLGQPQFPAEKKLSTITGQLLTLRGKPIPDGEVTLFSIADNLAEKAGTDAEGRFTFENLLIKEDVKYTVQGRNAKNSSKVELLVDGIPGMSITPYPHPGDFDLQLDQTLGRYHDAAKARDGLLDSLGLESRIIRLDEVTVTARGRSSYNLNGAGRADQVISANELTACPTLRMCLEGRLRGVRFEQEMTQIGPVSVPVSTRGGRMLVVVDGRELRFSDESNLMDIAGIFDQNLIDPADILSIEVLRSPSLTSMYGRQADGGVILINTRGWQPGQRVDFSVKTYAPRGFSATRTFYSPKYGHSPALDAQADARSTIHWDPWVATDDNGNATVSFANAGNPGTYRVVVEGIDANGRIGRAVYRYRIVVE